MMLRAFHQLLACRREREKQAAQALAAVRRRLDQAKADAEHAEARLARHHHTTKERQDKLYRRSLRSQLTKQQIDNLTLTLDLMAEETEAFVSEVRTARGTVAAAMKDVDVATQSYRRCRQASDRWDHLVQDVTTVARRQREQADEIAIDDDRNDRHRAGQG